MKDMAIYFKDVDVPAGLEAGEEIKKVFAFKEKCKSEKKVFFKGFSNVDSFRDVFRAKLEEIGWHETDLQTSEEPKPNDANKPPPDKEHDDAQSSPNEWLLDEEARTFITDLTQRPPGWDGTSSFDIARLRLIGTSLNRSGNDDFYLGNHDSNLILRRFRDGVLSQQEVQALIECGVVGFQHQNAPLWHWIARYDTNDPWRSVVWLAAIGNDAAKKHAIEVLNLASRPIPRFDEFIDEKFILTQWLKHSTNSQVFDSAISFLSLNAKDADIPLIQEVAQECTLENRTKIDGAIVGILTRSSLDSALKWLIDKEVEKIEASVEDSLFDRPQSLSTTTLISCLSAKSEAIRRRSARILFERHEITLDVAKTLLTDNNHEIRLLAAETLRRLGQELSDDVAKQALRIVRQGSLGLSGFLSGTGSTDDSYYERYVENRLAELDFSSLKAKSEIAEDSEIREVYALYSKFPSRLQSEIRENLTDGFQLYFEKRINSVLTSTNVGSALELAFRRNQANLRKKLCTHALSTICDLRKADDLGLIRNVIDKFELNATVSILRYLGRFGDWSDTNRIINLGNSSGGDFSLLSNMRSSLPVPKAAAIIAVGKGREADVLALDLDNSVRMSVAKQLPKGLFSALSDDVLLRELERDFDKYRVVFALRCVLSLKRSRISALLDRYTNSTEHRYYNSIHWLDLGASLRSEVAKSIAQRALHVSKWISDENAWLY